jgi:hypothetical protein
MSFEVSTPNPIRFVIATLPVGERRTSMPTSPRTYQAPLLQQLANVKPMRTTDFD